MKADSSPTFKLETLHEFVKLRLHDSSMKINKESLELLAEFLRLFTLEAIHRSAAVRLSRTQGARIYAIEGKPDVVIEDLETILAQLLLDF
ncbi:hypothetical protein HMI54_007586 [Coelomomyces lativittatus]|nr:hypothetical protein HMI55_002428 [Coelomomyces lativittatus]KAJ1503946.1 hypothetical protein HMI54_007586 [Coelomomyces lativittatus]KAJ1514194.1 hypothetical protein HMI56_000960 [Coelomomyces lativittatus]